MSTPKPGQGFIVSNWTAVDIGVYDTADSVVMTFYFLLVLVLGLWVGASLYAANIGSNHFLGLSSKGATSGIANAALQWVSSLQLCVLGWVVFPLYAKAEVVTTPEYLRKRFGSLRIQIFISVLYLFFCIFNRISLEISHCAMFLRMILGVDVYLAILVLLGITSIYTITGGLATVSLTNSLHTILMVFGSLLLTGFAFKNVGGYQELLNKYPKAIPRIISDGNWTAKPDCYLPRRDAFHIFRDAVSGDLPWPGLVFGTPCVSFYYWCTDQVFFQLCLAGKNKTQAKGGCLMCAYLKVLHLFTLVMPGMISRILYTEQVACVVPSECQKFCGASSSCNPIAYAMLVIKLLPSGLRGLLLSTVCASFMSTLASIFNGTSALFTLNIYTQLRPVASEKELMITGRFFVILLFAVTIVWVPIMDTGHSETLFEYKQAIRSFMTPPVTAVFLLAIFCKRVNEKGAFWGLTLGTVLGVSRLLIHFGFSRQWNCLQKSNCPSFLCGLHYLYFNLILLGICVLSMLIISLATDPIPDKHLYRLCWSLRNSQEERVNLEGELPWKRHSKYPLQPELLKEDQSCLWRTWNLFCGLDPQPSPKLAPEKVKEHSAASPERAAGLTPEEAAKRTEGARVRCTCPKPVVKWVVNALMLGLITLVTTGFIFYA
ncbi:sodium/glucose cotransporter 1-like [Ochotona curzoniae]|uniref:sodium/glucose cotransporter 1-like n=1 Tax=Ochotona curzoniae TaxID=130825 RepID=UPI001B350537|nr:sodium/glucose cotransporter 1-like [Ochotona curzoniae]